jgi:uncharacterized protein GlcG (DUF336 family)
LNIAIVDSGANLVTFVRVDGAQIGSIAISEHGKSYAAPAYRCRSAWLRRQSRLTLSSRM